MKRLTNECKISKNETQKFLRILTLVFLFVGALQISAQAAVVGSKISALQQKVTITGKVVDAASGEAVIGANVVEKGTTNGTMTDANGAYSLNVSNANAILIVSFIGYENQEVAAAGKNVIDVKLTTAVTGIQEIVVTALGIQKTSRSLTYATQQVDGSELTTVKDENMINSLEGKSAGLDISRSSSGVGGSSRIIIRGNKSISGNNEPLYVIDGLPINNSNIGQIGGAQLSQTMDGGDAISNLNPDDIESISVLKGASASALYGGMGENGVILITTKKGAAGKTTFDVTSSTSFDNPLRLPDLQNKYGPDNALNTAITNNIPTTWGALSPGSAINTNDLKKFFQTGVQTINGIALASGNDKNTYYFSYSNTSSTGIVPTNSLQKNNLYYKETAKVGKSLTIDGSASLITQDVKDRPSPGFNSNAVGEAYLYPGTEAAWSQLKSNYEVYNNVNNIWEQNYPYSSYNSTSYMMDNPYWTANKNPNDLSRIRTMFSAGLKWDITSELSLRARGNFDNINDNFNQDIYAGSTPVSYDAKGDYTEIQQNSIQIYNDVLLNYSTKKIHDFTIDATLGFSNTYNYAYTQQVNTIVGNNNMLDANVFSLSNLVGVFAKNESTSQTLNQSVFLSASFGYKNMLFLDLTGRNEWNSTIYNKSYFYPSIGGSWIVTEATGSNDVFSFLKLRASYSQVGNGLPYGINNGGNYLSWQTWSGSPTGAGAGLLNPSNNVYTQLKPELSTSTEFGANLRLFQNSIDLDVTYYDNNVVNQELQVTSPIGGYVPLLYVNAGQVQNQGIELTLGYKYAPKEGLRYSTAFNFAYNANKVVTVDDAAGLNQYVVTPYASTKICQVEMVKGGQYGDLYANTIARNANGGIVVDTAGNVQPAKNSAGGATFAKVGNPYSPTSLGWSNTFSYKFVTFRFLIDSKFGGNIISETESFLDANGRSLSSSNSRDAGVISANGVAIATGNTQIKNYYTSLSGIGQAYTYSATAIRLREISLGFDIPTNWSHSVLKGLNLTVYGKNLFFFYVKAPVDPESYASSATGLVGLESLNTPSTSSYGVSLKASF